MIVGMAKLSGVGLVRLDSSHSGREPNLSGSESDMYTVHAQSKICPCKPPRTWQTLGIYYGKLGRVYKIIFEGMGMCSPCTWAAPPSLSSTATPSSRSDRQIGRQKDRQINIQIHVRTQYSVDPGQPPPPPPIVYFQRTDFKYIYLFGILRTIECMWSAVFILTLKIKDPFLGIKAKTYRIVAWFHLKRCLMGLFDT